MFVADSFIRLFIKGNYRFPLLQEHLMIKSDSIHLYKGLVYLLWIISSPFHRNSWIRELHTSTFY